MIQLLFVNDLRNVNTRLQECRAHSSKVGHQRRRQKKAQLLEHSQQLNTCDYPSMNRKILSPPLIMQPPCPLILGPNAAPAAELDGHACIGYYVSRARSLCSVTTAFNMSAVHSLDWAEYMANRLFYHASAAFAHHIFEKTPVPSKKVLRHRGQAIKEVRRHLSMVGEDERQVDCHAIAAVAMLAGLDEMLGDIASHELHRKMVGVLLAGRGDVNREYDPTYFFVSSSELVWWLRTGYSVFRYHPITRHKSMLTEHYPLDKQSKFAALPAGFRALAATGAISAETAETVVIMQGAQTQTPECRPQRDPLRQDWFQVFPYLHPDHPDDLTFDELVELALLLFCTHIIVPCEVGLGVTYAARKKLAESLPVYLSLTLCPSETEIRTLLWVALLTLYAWQRAPQDPHFDEVSWLLLDLPLELLATLNGTQVQELLSQYLWNGPFLVFGKNRWESFNSEKHEGER